MLIGGIVLGLLLGLRNGGRLSNLGSIQLRATWILFAAVIVRFGTEALLNQGVEIIDALRVPLLTSGFALLLGGLYVNRGYPGLGLAFIGILLNAIVITINGGHMPIWEAALSAAGLTQLDVTSALHIVVPGTATDFLLRGLILGDVIPIPLPFVQNVASLGDVFLTLGLGFFLFAGVIRVPSHLEASEEEAIRRRLFGLAGATRLPRRDGTTINPETGLAPAIQDTASLDRPVFLGSQSGGTGLSSPALAPLPVGPYPDDLDDAAASAAFDASGVSIPGATSSAPTITLPRPSPEMLARVRRHPYVRLALNGSFSALWAGQLVSLFGDRLHLIALAFAVQITTGSALATAFVFVAGFIPNLVFSPIAGTFVDRWDHKEVMIVSDLLRAATVLIIPVAIVTSVWFVFPLVFLLTTISIFFRPARIAILPRIVAKDELVTANSALWVGETIADVVGLPLAALFVTALGLALPVAFWLDAATYIASAALISTMLIRDPVASDATEAAETAEAQAATADDASQPTGFFGEMQAGYRFLRSERTLFANTIQAAVAQLNVGVLTALTVAYTVAVFEPQGIAPTVAYGFIESGIGVGNLIGGFVIGLIGSRLAKGRLISAGYAVWGLCTVFLALSGNLGIVIGLAIGSGVANMVFIIPSQALFQERTPGALMGRVVGFRFALVFGSMALAMALGGILSVFIPVTLVIALFGLVSMGAGIAGFLVPAIRDAT
ncbi:MAG: MFS transporter [Candidatus Limnocylindrales bacterium]